MVSLGRSKKEDEMAILILSLVAGLVVLGGIWMATRDRESAEKDKSQPLSEEVVTLIEIKSLAEAVFGSCAGAEDWLNKPAIALEGHKPIELVSTRSGAALVKELLIRLDFSVTV